MHHPVSPSLHFCILSTQDTRNQLETDLVNGLDEGQVRSRRAKYGVNALDKESKETIASKFIAQFNNPLIMLLGISALISGLIGHWEDAISIVLTIIIVLSGSGINLVAFVQEYQSEKSLEALNDLAPPQCHVLRNGVILDEMASQLVPGDVIHFHRGDRIPADARVITASELEMDESSFTGETEPVVKTDQAWVSSPRGNALAERTNIVFMGSLVCNGHGSAIVIGTGYQTELGKIFHMMSEVARIHVGRETKDTLAK